MNSAKQRIFGYLLLLVFAAASWFCAEFKQPIADFCGMILLRADEASPYSKQDLVPAGNKNAPKVKVTAKGVSSNLRRKTGQIVPFQNPPDVTPTFSRHTPAGALISDSMLTYFACLGPVVSPWKGKSFRFEEFLAMPVVLPDSDAALQCEKAVPGAVWKHMRFTDPGGRLDLNKLFKAEKMKLCGGFLAVALEVPEAVPNARLIFGHDGGMRIYLNGKQIYDQPKRQGFKYNNRNVAVNLEKGRNVILVKTAKNGGGWNFALRLGDGAGKPIFFRKR